MGLIGSQDATGADTSLLGLGIATAVAASVAGGVILSRARSVGETRKEAPGKPRGARKTSSGDNRFKANTFGAAEHPENACGLQSVFFILASDHPAALLL
jgi:hypothetical protein